MIASLLENFDNVLNCCGMSDALVKAMYKDAEIYGISLSELKRWGEDRERKDNNHWKYRKEL